MQKLFFISLAIFLSFSSAAQNDTLPRFKAIKKNGEITISWINGFKNVTQLNIQRSKDSLKNFSTIHSVPNPNAKSYSYIDKTAKNDSGYYRIFILFEGTNYVFTTSKKLFIDTTKPPVIIIPVKEKQQDNNVKTRPPAKETPAKETPVDIQEEKPQPPPKPVWVPSIYIFTGDDGNAVMNLPEAQSKKYSVVFKNEAGEVLFKIPQVKETYLTLDKVNFLKSGWYYFDLMEDGKLKEKNKFLITRDN
ncbi:MAG: hypothetical protein QM725_09050 [Lacibacter sp.]